MSKGKTIRTHPSQNNEKTEWEDKPPSGKHGEEVSAEVSMSKTGIKILRFNLEQIDLVLIQELLHQIKEFDRLRKHIRQGNSHQLKEKCIACFLAKINSSYSVLSKISSCISCSDYRDIHFEIGAEAKPVVKFHDNRCLSVEEFKENLEINL